MAIKLLLDPHTKRVVYVAHDGVLPERITILEDGRQYLFSPATCEHTLYAGALPMGLGPQTCWNFRYGDSGLEALADAPASVRAAA